MNLYTIVTIEDSFSIWNARSPAHAIAMYQNTYGPEDQIVVHRIDDEGKMGQVYTTLVYPKE